MYAESTWRMDTQKNKENLKLILSQNSYLKKIYLTWKK